MSPFKRILPITRAFSPHQHLRRSILHPHKQAPNISFRLLSSTTPLHTTKRYTEDHEWILIPGYPPPPNTPQPKTLTATIGITQHAQSSLGDIVYVELPVPTTPVAGGDSFGTVESVKSASDIFSPITGTVKEVNEVLNGTPGLVNKDPEGDGWIVKIEVENDNGSGSGGVEVEGEGEGVDEIDGDGNGGFELLREELERLMTEEEYEAYKAGEKEQGEEE